MRGGIPNKSTPLAPDVGFWLILGELEISMAFGAGVEEDHRIPFRFHRVILFS